MSTRRASDELCTGHVPIIDNYRNIPDQAWRKGFFESVVYFSGKAFWRMKEYKGWNRSFQAGMTVEAVNGKILRDGDLR